MIIFLDFLLYLMEILKCWSLPYGYVMFIFLTTVNKGSTCEAPSPPECFRKNAAETVYTCEWSMNASDSNVTFDLYFEENKFGGIKNTSYQITEERLIRDRDVNIFVEAHMGNSSCMSPKKSVTLKHIVKYDAPQNILVSWLKNNLTLTWKAAEKHPALAEVWFRREGHSTESWEKRLINANLLTAHSSPEITTSSSSTLNSKMTSKYQVNVTNLLELSAYQVQIRHRPTQFQNPLWSKWSPVVTVPTELEHEPIVTMTTKLLNGTRAVTLTLKPVPHAAAVGGVNFTVEVMQSDRCPCPKKIQKNCKDQCTINVSYSAVTISVVARNAAGCSPSAIVQVPAAPVTNFKICNSISRDVRYEKKTCKQWYEFQDLDSRPQNVITLARKRDLKQVKTSMKNFVRYLYFEHRCDAEKPRTVEMCLLYQQEGVPRKEPQDLIAFSETDNSVNLSWKAIATVDQQGFLTHYRLCSKKISSQDEPKECHNISTSLIQYRLQNLTPGAKYNISLAGVTRMGAGPETTVTVNTLPETPVNVWLSFGLLLLFFFSSAMCTVILKRIKNKIFPPVPTPVIPDFSPCCPENQQETPEGKEEVNELTLLQLPPEGRSVPEDAGETTALPGEWDDGSDEDVASERADSRMSGGTGDESPDSTDEALRSSQEESDLEQVDNEIAMLIYRNGLVFDVKADSP